MDPKRNCFNCYHAEYVGEGAYWCSECDKIVIVDFSDITDQFYACDGHSYVFGY